MDLTQRDSPMLSFCQSSCSFILLRPSNEMPLAGIRFPFGKPTSPCSNASKRNSHPIFALQRTGTGDDHGSAATSYRKGESPTARPTNLAQVGSSDTGFSICHRFLRNAASNQNSGRPEKAIESKMVGFMLAHEQFTVPQVLD